MRASRSHHWRHLSLPDTGVHTSSLYPACRQVPHRAPLETTGLLACSSQAFGDLPQGISGLETFMLEAVQRTLAGEPRVLDITGLYPAALGRLLGWDRAPEAKTIRRKHHHVTDTSQVGALIDLMATKYLKTVFWHRRRTGRNPLRGRARPCLPREGENREAVLHTAEVPVPCHRGNLDLRFHRALVFVVMAEPTASLVSALRRLL